MVIDVIAKIQEGWKARREEGGREGGGKVRKVQWFIKNSWFGKDSVSNRGKLHGEGEI